MGLARSRPQVEPLADPSIRYFALDNLAYHGHNISIAYDAAGRRYAGKGCAGVLCAWVDGRMAARSATLARLDITLA